MAYRKRRRARRNPEYKGWRRVMQKKSTGDFLDLVSMGAMGYFGYKIWQWATAPKQP